MSKNFYITTAISYANGVPHLGHAYEAILTDVMARFKRLDGYSVKFLTGTDEHGEKVLKTAQESGMTAIDFATKNAGHFKDMCNTLNISYDDFIRTTETRHKTAAQAIWTKLVEKGDIYLGKYEGWYSIREEAYFAESELTKDTKTDAYKTPHGTDVKWVEEESYFFKLSAYTEKLLALYEARPEFIQPASRRNEIISFVKGGLKDLSVSRHKSRLEWGVEVPGDPDHVMYVWLDALTNYISGIGYPETQTGLYKVYWPADFHVIGKDITRFHTVYWPAFLLSAGLELPKAVFAHGFINIDGEKMSKSIGNVLSPDGLVQTYGCDQFRYFLMREIPHGQDGNFSHEQAVLRMNADLANGLGNLAQRTLSMIYKNCDGVIPAPAGLEPQDEALLTGIRDALLPVMRKDADDFRFDSVLRTIMEQVSAADAYVDTTAPWKLKTENPERMRTVLYVLVECVRCLAIAMLPVTPEGAGRLLDQLKIPQEQRNFAALSESAAALKPLIAIEQPTGVFPRLDLTPETKLAAG